MRVHRLEITAFGPFADTQVVDFAPLNAAGVFLLTGHTGAGKTSILDAICFGLFGQVPGVRDKAKEYRSHHAPPETPPRVVLEVTLGGRRLRLTRQPTWSRPSRRATSGFVDEPARGLAEELVDGRWITRSTRTDEVGHLVGGLLGLNRDQFCQVVMLPQGDFQAFLRAAARERQHILETLFGTQRFQDVERWLAEHRRRQSRHCRELEEQVTRLLARLHEACSPPTPGLAIDPSALSVDRADLLDSVQATIRAAALEVRSTREHSDETSTSAKEALHALDEARGLAERRERHREARRRHAALVAMPDVVSARESRLRRARAAAPLYPLVELARDAAHRHVSTKAACTALLADWVELPDQPVRPADAAEASRAVAALVERMSRLDQLAELAREVDTLAGRVAAETTRRNSLAASIDKHRLALTNSPGRAAELRTALEQAAGVVRAGADAAGRRSRAVEALTAAEQVETHRATLADLESALLAARESTATATEVWLDARERRLAGIAAELAGQLVEGACCPVCGSLEHPAPAAPIDEPVGADEESELLGRVDSGRADITRIETTRAETLARQAEALARSRALDPPAARAEVEGAEHDQTAAVAAAAEQRILVTALEALSQRDEGHRGAVEQAVIEVARLDERVVEGRRRLGELSNTIDDEIGGTARLPDACATTRTALDRAHAVEAALRTGDEAVRAQGRAQRSLAAALEPTEFGDGSDVVAAALSPAEIAVEESLARAHHVEMSTWSRVLADPTLVAAAAEPEPDLANLDLAARQADHAARGAHVLAAALDRRQSRLTELAASLADLLTTLAPAREARDLAEQVAGLCAGSSTDNLTRTALSHYVLAARLSQVVQAANHRLDAIAGGRYQLEHTMVKGAGDTRGGLGLVVRDTHTDTARDPATLSGGETFYVSLSLALGLADVVTAEAGGAELSTLFVDEGFGTLDDDTRDEVLDELDTLRAGGRSVGLVSHLSELRARCPAQLHVVASAQGSRCLPVRAAGC